MAALLGIPLLGVLGLWLLPERWRSWAWWWSLLITFATFCTAVRWLFLDLPVEQRHNWIPAIGAQILLVLDGASVLFALLSSLIFFLSTLSAPGKAKTFYALLLVMESAAMGFFLAQDLLLLFLCFEAVLIPMYFVIGVWGGEKRQRAAVKFVIFTAAGSAALLIGILTLYLQAAGSSGVYTFEMSLLLNAPLAAGMLQFCFWAILLGFAVKVPMLPLHTWLPDAHTEAPTAGSVVLAAILLKMGTYGIFRLCLPLLRRNEMGAATTEALMALSVVAILYGAFVSLAQQDAKRLIAYSSVSHLGFCTLGLFSLNESGVSGSLLQQINHGISTSLLFFLIGFIYERRGTRELSQLGGLARPMPRMSVAFGMAILGSAGLPLLNGFVGEFMILRGAYLRSPLYSYIGVAGIVVAAAYLLVLFEKTMLGPIRHEANRQLSDLHWREWCVVLPLLAWSIWIGVAPQGHFRLLEAPVRKALGEVQP